MSSALFFPGEEHRLTASVSPNKDRQIILLCDAKTNGFCLSTLLRLVPACQYAARIVIPDGEANKTLETANFLWEELLKLGADRHSVLLCLGGGMLSDLGGFAAAVYKRGIEIVYIPTTLLSMVDAAHGGKTGLDFQQIKNLLGCFRYPKAIYVQPQFLQTLPDPQIRSGIAEMIKHALIDSVSHWETIRNDQPNDFIQMDRIRQSIMVKLALVEQDEEDRHIRQALNFGHSIGHALESASLQTKHPLLHGEAIALGMETELRLSVQYHQLDPIVLEQYQLLRSRIYPGLQVNVPHDAVLDFLLHDKKNRDGVRMSLLSRPGHVEIGTAVRMEDIVKALEQT